LPKTALRYLSVDAVKQIHEAVLAAHGGTVGLRDAALLASAVAAPQASFAGKPLLRSGVEIAAAYLFYLCRNHPFVDGNKRTALGSCLAFLEANALLTDDALPGRDVAAWEALVLDVASSKLNRQETTRRLRRLLAPMSRARKRKK
jgi:death-on-curing protein